MAETGIEYHAHLPLAWRDGALPQAEVVELMRDNVLTLQALAALETSHAPSSHERDHDRPSLSDRQPLGDQQMPRIEAKLDLLLHWVGALLLERHPMPPSTEVTLGARRLTWLCPVALSAASEGVIALYLAPRLPAALHLPVRIASYENGRAHATLLHMTEDAQDWLDRTLFRYHRRTLQARVHG